MQSLLLSASSKKFSLRNAWQFGKHSIWIFFTQLIQNSILRRIDPIMSWTFKMLILEPCNDKLNSFNFKNISASCATLHTQTSSMNWVDREDLCSLRNASISFLSSYTDEIILSRDSQYTSVCSSRVLWMDPISWHNEGNTQEWRGLALMKRLLH